MAASSNVYRSHPSRRRRVNREQDAACTTTTDHAAQEAEQTFAKASAEAASDDEWDSEPWKQYGHPLPSGLDIEDFWLLLRRFNKQVSNVRETATLEDGDLDLRLAPSIDFSANKFQKQVERLYMGAFLGILTAFKHCTRLRSWREPRRTGVFCAVYFVSWYFNMLLTVLLLVAICMVLSARTRSLLFPPAPISMIDWNTGGPTKPPSGVLGSTAAATGAPERYKGQAVENEAKNFVSGVAGIAVNVLTVEDPKHQASNTQGESHPTDSLPGPTDTTLLAGVVKDKARGVENPSQDKTKQPLQMEMWNRMLPIMLALNDISDIWEMCANALEPTPPYPKYKHRLRLTLPLVLILLFSWTVPVEATIKGSSALLGLITFGQPCITQFGSWLGNHHPQWSSRLRLQNSILKGVPNNAQLLLGIIRMSERHGLPLPPVPEDQSPPDHDSVSLDNTVIDASGQDKPLGASQATLAEMAAADYDVLEKAGGPTCEIQYTGGHKTGRVIGLFKKGTRAAVHVALGADKLRAKAGRQSAQNRIGIVPPKDKDRRHLGPVEFRARYEGHEGSVRVSWSEGIGVVSFEQEWVISTSSIVELKKLGALGIKSKFVVGWAMERTVTDGLEIRDRTGRAYVLTAVLQRDQLFNRLCAMDSQRWEVW